MSYKVYKLTSPIGRVYVGVTRQEPETRWKNGFAYRANPELFEDIVSYGWNNFIKEILYEVEDRETAYDLERQTILNYPDGYNHCRVDQNKENSHCHDEAKPVVCIETGITYPSIKEAARQTGLNKCKISKVCRGIKYTMTGGYHWKFAE